MALLLKDTSDDVQSFLKENAVFYEETKHKRNPTKEEIAILEKNGNRSSHADWTNVFVSEKFDVSLIHNSEFANIVILGSLEKAKLQFHDLIVDVGIYNSHIESAIIDDMVSIKNVAYLVNYRIGSQSILLNVDEISCTNHAKFGVGILKEGEKESDRIWLEIGNENGGRKVLAFESMIPADAYIWSRYRDDSLLMTRLQEITEKPYTKKLDTMGFIDHDVVIKHCGIIKDVKIGSHAYLKGALKLKNITVLSSYDEPSQIGEGVEMVNGIMGYGSKIFYQVVAVRFVVGRNCQLKYGVRLLNTVLGDNSTVSCCELLNNLIFPFHEQHHNSSFLIASTVSGQSNIASGATIGSNHNSRSPDGELFARRGFWPGLCCDFKHNCNFASFTLVSKGSYPNELNITYPFSLVSRISDEEVVIIPAYWFMYNMYAMSRNNDKFKKRDKRFIKKQIIETAPLAPDTIQEVMSSLDRIIELTALWLEENEQWFKVSAGNTYQAAKDFLHKNPHSDISFVDYNCMKKHGTRIIKPVQGYKEYRKIAKYFATKTLMEYAENHNIEVLSLQDLQEIEKLPLYTSWVNVGGQVVPEALLANLFEKIKTKEIDSWEEIHQFYEDCQVHYAEYKASYALYLLEQLYSTSIEQMTPLIYDDILQDVLAVSDYMYSSSISSREKDYEDPFRLTTFRSKEEMIQVVGALEDNDFLKALKIETETFNQKLTKLFAALH